MKSTILISALIVLGGVAGSAAAQEYPTKPIRFVMPFAVGGAAELFARTVAQKMSETLGKQVVVDARPGANGIIGTEIVARSPADGYTLLMGNTGPLAINLGLYLKLPYDPIKDFAPISQGTLYPYILISNPSLKARNVPELIALAKSRPADLAYASNGIGSSTHLAGELFNLMAGVKLLHVPYKGSAAAMTDVIGGQLPLMFNTISTSVAFIKSGKLRAYAVTGTKRARLLPDIQTLDESGLKGYDVTSWQGVLAPVGTPRAIIMKLNSAIVNGLKSKDVIEHLTVQGDAELVGSTPEQFAALIKAEVAMYGKLIADAGIRAEETGR